MRRAVPTLVGPPLAGLLLAGLLLAGLLLAGCGGPSTVPGGGSDAGSAAPVAQTIQPANLDPTSIGLFHDDGDVHVGDIAKNEQAKDDALNVYLKPRGAYDLTEVPTPLANQPSNPYGVAGWESYKGEGYGLILYNAKVVVAMYQVEGTQESTVDKYVDDERSKMPAIEPVEFGGEKLHYWFWRDKDKTQSLMICRLDAGKGSNNLTVAMGDDNVLRALGVSEAAARANAPRIDRTSRPPVLPPGSTSPNIPH